MYELHTRMFTVTDSAWILDSIVNHYVGFDTSAKTIFKSRSLENPVFKKIDIDSFKKARPDTATISQFIPIMTLDRKIRTAKDHDIYYFKVNHPSIDSFILQFDKSMVGLPYSYSRYFDGLYRSKLSKIELKLAPGTPANAPYLNKFRYITWQFRHMEPGDKTEKIITFCEKLEAAYRKL